MNRSEIHQQICHSIEQQLSMKGLQQPSLTEQDSYSLDIAALFHELESQFHLQLDLKRDLRGIRTIEDLSNFIYARTHAA